METYRQGTALFSAILVAVGTIVVKVSAPMGAEVSLNGTPRGSRGIVRLTGVEANHEQTVVVHREGYEDQILRASVQPDEEVELRVRLHHARRPSHHPPAHQFSSRHAPHHSSRHH